MIFSDAAIKERKNKTAQALFPVLKDDQLVLVYAGTPITKPGGHDQTYPFLPHPDYFWLTGSRRAYGVSVFSRADGWKDFVLPITREEKIWEGGGETIKGTPLAELNKYLDQFKNATRFNLGQSSDPFTEIQEIFNEVRRAKDQEEVALVTRLGGMAAQGYKKIKQVIRPGLTERDLQIEYETTVLRAGAEKMPYESIVGVGTNSAILHAIPTMRVLKDGEHVLIDAGADLHDYCVDITRNFPVNGTFTELQQKIHDTVLKAQSASIALCRPGSQWKDVHLASARAIAEGLKELGVLNCSIDAAIENEVVGVFLPHGVGHMVGLRVRDVGGRPNPNPKKYAGARLRIDMELKQNYLMTVEPGMYFIEALLNDSETRDRFKHEINWNRALEMKEFGGMRIEDDILVTEQGPKNLTAAVGEALA